MMTDDMEMVRAYAERQSEPAFATLVARYVNLVYSAAQRQVGDSHLAEEVTQAVFIILARKAASLGPDTILPSWLHRTAIYVAADALKTRQRRTRRDQEAHMQSLLNDSAAPINETWSQIAPLLDNAIAGLNDKERHAIVLRYFENRSLAEIGHALGANEDAARMRVNRALEKLRKYFTKRGVNSTTAIIAGALSTNSVQAAPVGLASSITTVAIAKGAAAGGSTLTLSKGALKLMAWTKAKTAVVVGTVAILTIATTTVTIKIISQSHNPWKDMDSVSPSQINQAFGTSMQNQSSPAPSREQIDGMNKKIDDIYARFFNEVPAGIVIQSTHFKTYAIVRYGPNKIIGRAVPFETLLSFAYETNGQPFFLSRMVIPPDLPEGDYDFFVNEQGNGLEMLQTKIKQEFAFTGRVERLETNVLALAAKGATPSNLKTFQDFNPREYEAVLPIWLAERLGILLHRPVAVDSTLALPATIALPKKSEDLELIKKVLADQFGPIDLVPTNMPIEMLVVEKAK